MTWEALCAIWDLVWAAWEDGALTTDERDGHLADAENTYTP